jgi:hypothetical protein
MATTTTEHPEVEVLTETPVEERKPLKLSEALRLGSMGTKQARGTWHKVDADGNDLMCALSTAWYALTGEKEHDAQSSALQKMLAGTIVSNPVSGVSMQLDSAIIELNDHSGWNRGQIADWLEGLGL